jgi:AcrR family transcriptional regulator
LYTFVKIHKLETSEYILTKVAPVFNKRGFMGTSLADITKATKMTKGAVYGNFSNKEDLALQSFEYNVKVAIYPLFKELAFVDGSIDKLFAITRYQRSYYSRVRSRGGCPLLRAGVDTKFINPRLFAKAQALSTQMLQGLIAIIEDGQAKNEIHNKIDASVHAKLLLSVIEGSSFLSFTHNDPEFIENAMDFIDKNIIEHMK